MTRCDYDVIFYRVFCLSLLVIAFIFTVILTNVFVDIDGLLSRKDKAASNHDTEETYEESTVKMLREIKPEIVFNDERNYEDNEDGYRKDDVYGNEEEIFRNKRSLESQSFLFHLKNANLKNVLTSHLNALLEQLEAEELNTNSIDDRKPIKKEKVTNKPTERRKPVIKVTDVKTPTVAEVNKTNTETIRAAVEVNDIKCNKSSAEDRRQNEMMHLAMHDILLQGIIGHLDLNEVYKKINILTKNMNMEASKQDFVNSKNGERRSVTQHGTRENEEDKFFLELIKCKKLQDEIREIEMKRQKLQIPVAVESKPQMTIRAIIDISGTDDKTKQEKDLNSKDIQGLIKFKYNGKPIKVKIISSSEQINPSTSTQNIIEKAVNLKKDMTEKVKRDDKKIMTNQDNSITNEDTETDPFESTPVKFTIPQSYLNRAVANYLKKYDYLKANSNEFTNSKRTFNNKRFKRHIKIHYDPLRNKTKSEDDELYVEIETHFDSKGMKGEKRKKLIRNLIEKIENAIHSNVEQNKTKKHYHAHVKKRTQNPLIFENIIEQSGQNVQVTKKIPLKSDKTELRHVDPISKLVNVNQKFVVPNIYDKVGEGWRKKYEGPNFLAPSKALNSAELSEVDVDYNRVMTFNGIPQRLQKPLNTENSDEAFPTNYYDLGNLKFFIKDIDHSGISVGFNQYTDEEPDPETIKIFTGVDSLVKAYNQNYGKTYPIEERVTENQLKKQYDYNNNDVSPEEHNIKRRSVLDQDYHSNEYKMIYDSKVLPYKNYQEIFGFKPSNHTKLTGKPLQQKNNTEKPITMDFFNSKLKPSEIFSLANMLEGYRKKRSIVVKKYSNLNTRRKLNKFLQTKTNKIFINKKRIKRHIDKIRIIATDRAQKARQMPYNSPDDHNIFVVSNEDDFSKRAVLREVLQPGDELNERPLRPERIQQVYDYIPHVPDQEYLSNVYEETQPVENYITHVFDGRSRHNPLMSKYPHVFMEEISKAKEMDVDHVESGPYDNIRNEMTDIENKFNVDQYDMPVQVFDMTTENYYPTTLNITPPKESPNTKTKYKLSVKIMPKNITELKAGFKEIHTSINKSYDKDGLRFFTLVNVSEISKVENIEKPKPHTKTHNNESEITTTTINPRIVAQQLKLKSMLKRHKQMIDSQLTQLVKEKEHLDNILIQNQTESDEVLDVKLPGVDQPIHLKKKDLTKLLASMMRIHPNASVPLPVEQNQPTHNVQSTTLNLPTTTRSTTTLSLVNTKSVPEPIKATDKKLINIIEKNGKLTKEILNKIDRNTEILQSFLVKLIDRIGNTYDRPVPATIEKPVDVTDSGKNLKEGGYMTEDFNTRRDNKNDSNYAIPFVYAFQQPVSQNKPNSPVTNLVYHGHIHTDRQLTNEINKLNPKLFPKFPVNVETKMDKSKLVAEHHNMPNDFKNIREAIVKSTTYHNPTSLNTTRSYFTN